MGAGQGAFRCHLRPRGLHGAGRGAGSSSPLPSALGLHPVGLYCGAVLWVAQVVCEIAQAVEYLNTMGVAHRDLKVRPRTPACPLWLSAAVCSPRTSCMRPLPARATSRRGTAPTMPCSRQLGPCMRPHAAHGVQITDLGLAKLYGSEDLMMAPCATPGLPPSCPCSIELHCGAPTQHVSTACMPLRVCGAGSAGAERLWAGVRHVEHR